MNFSTTPHDDMTNNYFRGLLRSPRAFPPFGCSPASKRPIPSTLVSLFHERKVPRELSDPDLTSDQECVLIGLRSSCRIHYDLDLPKSLWIDISKDLYRITDLFYHWTLCRQRLRQNIASSKKQRISPQPGHSPIHPHPHHHPLDDVTTAMAEFMADCDHHLQAQTYLIQQRLDPESDYWATPGPSQPTTDNHHHNINHGPPTPDSTDRSFAASPSIPAATRHWLRRPQDLKFPSRPPSRKRPRQDDSNSVLGRPAQRARLDSPDSDLADDESDSPRDAHDAFVRSFEPAFARFRDDLAPLFRGKQRRTQVEAESIMREMFRDVGLAVSRAVLRCHENQTC
ncbi:hypothetical protein P168DRAFT_289609 [Aspergillus campestris IBT 28561]|uniref:Uncharacterized protein n=1 Tax=Aspergillus campestris (strain IBT 28561) TaxID=1392248 RepID=A0A2I1D4E3_ASPC2|nr:uncharacterized protein P168DRAFT_289609 [Aspergillus campestris IBT 28561]PKY04744.1 hypothetical protein P168DRAFT_289609 [Aspergillus campestris IBT 28561]